MEEQRDDLLIERMRDMTLLKKETPPVADSGDIDQSETDLGFALTSFHRRLLAEVANGGTEYNVRSWCQLCLRGNKNNTDSFFDATNASKRKGINPFTGETIDYKGEGPPLGKLIYRRPLT